MTRRNFTICLFILGAALVMVSCALWKDAIPDPEKVTRIITPELPDATPNTVWFANEARLSVAVRKVIPYRITNAWNAVAGATGYEIGIGETSGHYSRLINVGGALSAPVTGLLASATYYIAVRACNQWATGKWSAEFKWPWPWTNSITVPPGCEMTDRLQAPNWMPIPTNVFHNLKSNRFFRGVGSKTPITISITNNVTGYEHRD